MSLENNQQYVDEMWRKINEYVEQGKITEQELIDLDFYELVKKVKQIEEGDI